MNKDTQADVMVDIENPTTSKIAHINGLHDDDTSGPTVEELERELPVVYDGQIQLGDLLSRIVQSIYAELSELAETMPNMSDSARKRTLADWVVKTKKQVVKLYAVVKWSRDADTIQKCMNIIAFLLTQNSQFEDTVRALTQAKENLDPARLRNHDLLTSLDVLTTGSYLRLPTCIKKLAIPIPPLTDVEVAKTLFDMEETLRYRLRMSEIIPVEMSRYFIADGRAHFSVPKLFNASVCLRGGAKDDGWFFVSVEFMINMGGDLTGLQEFPRIPAGIIKRHITDEADARLAFYLPLPESQPPLTSALRPQLPPDVTDAPLVRLFNFLQMMSLSYQLEILWYQAERLRSLGWADFLSVQMSPDRKIMKASYWVRPPQPTQQGRPRLKLPLLGGTLTISIVQTKAPPQTGPGPARTSKQRVLSRLQQKSKLGNGRPSDEVEGLKFVVHWEAAKGALGIVIPQEESVMPPDTLKVDPDNLDFERMLRTVIQKHAKAILNSFSNQLRNGPNKVFSPPGIVSMIPDGETQALQVHLCADEVVIITIDTRTGRLTLRDTGDLAAAGRGPRFAMFSERLNDNPTLLMDALFRLRITTILDLAEQKASYLGLQSYRRRNINQDELSKLGSDARASLYIQLATFPNHYLVLVITDERFKYALITTTVQTDSMYGNMVLEDIAWLDFDRIHDASVVRNSKGNLQQDELIVATKKLFGFHLDTQGLRELYSYCCARVAFINVERQFKLRGIPFTHVPTSNTPLTYELSQIQSSLARSVPALCVQSEHILSGAPAAEAAMPNIRVIPLNWWSNEKAQVVTCVKLKYVQQPMGKTAGGGAIIRPSKRIIYDTTEAVVSFLSENVNTCVDEFLEEWARVSKMVVIAREVAQMSKHKKWSDVRLLSFDLQTVEFTYAEGYAVSISCQDQLSLSGGNFDLEFARIHSPNAMEIDNSEDGFNPHEDAEPFLRDILRQAHGRLAPSLHLLVTLLRDTLPIVVELENIRKESKLNGRNLDIFAKASGWYRLLYGDLKHALDFRLMNDQNIAILDSSHSLFDVQTPGKTVAGDSLLDNLVLQPIPRMREIVADAVQNGLASGQLTMGKVAAIDIGVICNASGVGVLMEAIHAQIVEELKK
ncbi:MED14-domain-containing protein [Pholiota conissans]|uniref:Mediator of RNA polymerase II transcription subunit 14 n=1 Tax=Pholiota conissans TaxID=109636 RepID=A0A9P5ZAM0_9AGAR|nr:MED14-domain-containing protein [Pholiota conissans]